MSLKNQSFSSFEVILVCIKIDKRLKEMAQKYGAFLLEDRGLGRCYARNLGITKANGEIIAFLDDDVVLKKDWLERVIKEFVNPCVGGVGGLAIPVNALGYPRKESLSKLFIYDLLGKVQGIYTWTSRLGYKAVVDCLSGSNMAFRSNVISLIDGFDENFYGSSIGEDVDFCLRVRSRGILIVFDPKAIAYHYSNYVKRVRRKDMTFFISTADNETYCKVKNNVYSVFYFLYQVLEALYLSTMTANPKVFFGYLKGILIGFLRGNSWKKSRD